MSQLRMRKARRSDISWRDNGCDQRRQTYHRVKWQGIEVRHERGGVSVDV